MIKKRTLWSSPSANLPGKLDTDDLGAFKLPRNTSHDVNGVGTTNTTSNHTQTTSVWRMGVRSDHQSAGERIILEDDLMDDTRTGFPESHIILQVEMDRVRNGRVPVCERRVTFAVEVPKKSYTSLLMSIAR